MTQVSRASGLCGQIKACLIFLSCFLDITVGLLSSLLALAAHSKFTFSGARCSFSPLLLHLPSRSEFWAPPVSGWVELPLALFLYCIIFGFTKMSLPSTLMSKSNLSCCQHRLSFLFPLGKAEEPGECYLLLPVGKSGGWVHSLAITCGRASSLNSLHSFSSYASVRSWLTYYLPCRQGDWTGLCGHAPTHDPPGFPAQKLLCSLCH